MNGPIFILTLREFIGQRRFLLLFILVSVPIALALIFHFIGQDSLSPSEQQEWAVDFLMHNIIAIIILPLACLILGTAAIGSEIEDGTAIYLLAKPISRLQIVISKFISAALLSMVFIVPATIVSGLISTQSIDGGRIVLGFTIAVALGVIAYTALFLFLSIATRRALLIGLAYVFIWEGLATQLFQATSYLSIRQYCLSISDYIAATNFSSGPSGSMALALTFIVIFLALFLAVRRLESTELAQSD